MPKFAANLSMLFTEHPFLERFERAKAAGFQAVEFLFPYEYEIAAIARELRRNELEQVLFNLPAGNFAAGDRGMANDPRRIEEFRAGVEEALKIANELRCGRLNCLAGLRLSDVPEATQTATLVENLRFAADSAARAGVLQVVEPLNAFDAPGYFLPTPESGFAIVEQAAHPNLLLQYDVYHSQRMSGNLVATITARIGLIGHVQIADSPARNEPGTGEINYPYVLQALDDAGYDGWVSLEYRPRDTTESSLAWLTEMGFWPAASARI
ncbi:MAG: hydroxypyruvate isomerase family protein [Chloroflexi bacterium]|nr:hydroxypyruvate isomerase family protein [Chloroflexota bacterium]